MPALKEARTTNLKPKNHRRNPPHEVPCPQPSIELRTTLTFLRFAENLTNHSGVEQSSMLQPAQLQPAKARAKAHTKDDVCGLRLCRLKPLNCIWSLANYTNSSAELGSSYLHWG